MNSQAKYHVPIFSPVTAIRFKINLGETDFSSNIFDGFSYTGAALASDDRMLPWELRGYAPQISGIAQTNATVTISQSGRVIYQKKSHQAHLSLTTLISLFRAHWMSK